MNCSATNTHTHIYTKMGHILPHPTASPLHPPPHPRDTSHPPSVAINHTRPPQMKAQKTHTCTVTIQPATAHTCATLLLTCWYVHTHSKQLYTSFIWNQKPSQHRGNPFGPKLAYQVDHEIYLIGSNLCSSQKNKDTCRVVWLCHPHPHPRPHPVPLLSLKAAANFPAFLINAGKGRALMSQDEPAQRGGSV